MRRLASVMAIAVALAISVGGCGTSSKASKKAKSKRPVASQQVSQASEEEAKLAAAREAEARRMAEIRAYMEHGQQELQTAFASELSNKTMVLDMIDDRTLRLTLSNAAAFDVGSATLRKAAGKTLHNLSENIVELDKTNVTVVGHTDNSGSVDANMALSQKRANAVLAYLAKHDVPAERMVAEGRGDQEPIDTNSTKEGRANNRRVEIWLRYAD